MIVTYIWSSHWFALQNQQRELPNLTTQSWVPPTDDKMDPSHLFSIYVYINLIKKYRKAGRRNFPSPPQSGKKKTLMKKVLVLRRLGVAFTIKHL